MICREKILAEIKDLAEGRLQPQFRWDGEEVEIGPFPAHYPPMAMKMNESYEFNDARIQIAVKTLTSDEIRILKLLSELPPGQARDLSLPNIGQISMLDERGLSGLLRKGCVSSVAVRAESHAVFYGLTSFGFSLSEAVGEYLAKVEEPVPEETRNGDEVS